MLFNNRCEIRRNIDGDLGAYNRPTRSEGSIGYYACKLDVKSNNNTQLNPQNKVTGLYKLYIEVEAEVLNSDIIVIDGKRYTALPLGSYRTHKEAQLTLVDEV